jgi:hypothetical protein
MRSWRRLHGLDVIAQVEPVGGFGTWTASAWRINNPRQPVRDDRAFELLADAQNAADLLARQLFEHTCNPNCGRWLGRSG